MERPWCPIPDAAEAARIRDPLLHPRSRRSSDRGGANHGPGGRLDPPSVAAEYGRREARVVGLARRAAWRARVSTAPPMKRRSKGSGLAGADEFLAGSADRPGWTQLGGHPAAGITDPGERNQTSAGDQHGCD